MIALSTPYGSRRLIRELGKELKRKVTRRDIQNSCYYLHKQRYLYGGKKNEGVNLHLSPRGERVARTYALFKTQPLQKKLPILSFQKNNFDLLSLQIWEI